MRKVSRVMFAGALLANLVCLLPVHAANEDASVFNCKSGHIADMFGDGGSDNFFVSIDNKKALPLLNEVELPAEGQGSYPVTILIFGEEGEHKARAILAQGKQRADVRTGDHGISVSYVDEDGKVLIDDHYCYPEPK